MKEYDERFDLFIRDYLTLKTRQIPTKKRVYESFKRYVADKKHPEALEETIAEIDRYSKHMSASHSAKKKIRKFALSWRISMPLTLKPSFRSYLVSMKTIRRAKSRKQR